MAVAVPGAVGVAIAAQDRSHLKTPNGITFSEFEGYEAWQVIAPSQPDDPGGCGSAPPPGCIKAVLGNPAMIKAYHDGISDNGKPVPDGAVMAKVEWAKKYAATPPYGATVPGRLIEVSFMVKDSKRFPPRADGGTPPSDATQPPMPGSRSATTRRSRTPVMRATRS